MHIRGNNRSRKNKHQGAFLAAALLWSLSAMGCAFLTHQTAYKIFETFTWRTYLLRRENAAVQTAAFVSEWFAGSGESGMIAGPCDFMPDAPPSEAPQISIPEEVLLPVRELYPNLTIEASVIDGNYCSLFQAEAERLGIPQSSPALFEIEYDDASPDIYGMKRYSMVVTVSSPGEEDYPLMIATDICLIMDEEENIRALTLYTKKH